MNAGTLQVGCNDARSAGRVLRLIADDLTGAVDTAAKFATTASPIRVSWSGCTSTPPSGARVIDTGCREKSSGDAATAFAHALPLLDPAADAISFLKLDSLLRGHAGAEIAACARRCSDRPIVVAPALPEQNRVTRASRQVLATAGHSEIVGEDFAATISAAGVTVALRSPGEPPMPGVNIVDAETDDDLDRIVDATYAADPLWCGSSGLAKAIARRAGRADALIRRSFAAPLLGIFGSNHDVLMGQLAAVRSLVVPVRDVGTMADEVVARLKDRGIVLVTLAHPDGTSRNAARTDNERRLARLLDRIPRPAMMIVSGGETLRAVANALGAEALDVEGEVETGVPISRLCGGRWDGVGVLSKSGAFGPPDLLERLLRRVEPQDMETPT